MLMVGGVTVVVGTVVGGAMVVVGGALVVTLVGPTISSLCQYRVDLSRKSRSTIARK